MSTEQFIYELIFGTIILSIFPLIFVIYFFIFRSSIKKRTKIIETQGVVKEVTLIDGYEAKFLLEVGSEERLFAVRVIDLPVKDVFSLSKRKMIKDYWRKYNWKKLENTIISIKYYPSKNKNKASKIYELYTEKNVRLFSVDDILYNDLKSYKSSIIALIISISFYVFFCIRITMSYISS